MIGVGTVAEGLLDHNSFPHPVKSLTVLGLRMQLRIVATTDSPGHRTPLARGLDRESLWLLRGASRPDFPGNQWRI